MKNKTKDFTQGLSFGQKFSYHLLHSIIYTLSLLPLRALYAISDLLYLLIYRAVGYRKRLVRESLRSSFPDKTHDELRAVERKFYHWFCDYIVETIKLASMSQEEMKRRVTFDNIAYLQQLVDAQHNVALYLGHYCNWEWVTSIRLHLHSDILGGQVYHPLENKAFDRLMLKLRSSMDTESIPMSLILRRILQTRKEQQTCVIGFISDQVPLFQSTHYWTHFLNHPDTLVITGTERIAKQFDFACVYLDVSRPKRGHYHIQIVPMVEHAKDYADWDITEMYFRLFEQTILREPAYWLWTHNRWKRTLEGLHTWKNLFQRKAEPQQPTSAS